jgi:hypothetical protein
MVLLIIALIAAIAGVSFIDNNNTSNVMNEYCKLECQERKIRKYKFCC